MGTFDNEEYDYVVNACKNFCSTKAGGIMILRLNSENQYRVARLLFAFAQDLTKKEHRGCKLRTVETWIGYLIQAIRNDAREEFENIFFNEEYPDMIFVCLDFSWLGLDKEYMREAFIELLKSCVNGNRHLIIATQDWPRDDIPGDELREILKNVRLLNVPN